MTADRNTPQSAANGESDARVTQTYREIAAPGAPEHLNQAMLNEAANAARPRYPRLITWTRPAAWAAVVMLSVTLVLQIAKAPTPEAVTFERDSSKLEVTSPEFEKAGSNVPTRIEMIKSTAKQAPLGSVPGKRQSSKPQQERVDEQEMPAAAASADEFKLKDVDTLRHAEDMARIQSDDNQEIDQQAPASFTASISLESAATETCSEEMTAAPVSWLECIEDLEKAGRVEEANQQRRQLQISFPDFELP
jgi:hypothetical protein